MQSWALKRMSRKDENYTMSWHEHDDSAFCGHVWSVQRSIQWQVRIGPAGDLGRSMRFFNNGLGQAHLFTNSTSSLCPTGERTKRAARASRPLVRRMYVSRVSNVGSSAFRRDLLHGRVAYHSPSITLVAINTTVNFIPLSLVLFFLSAISLDNAVSCCLSAA